MEEKKITGTAGRTMNYKMFFVEQIFLTFHLSARDETGKKSLSTVSSATKGIVREEVPLRLL